MGGLQISIKFPDDQARNDEAVREQLRSADKMLTEQKPTEQNIDEVKRGDTGQESNDDVRNRLGRIEADQAMDRLR